MITTILICAALLFQNEPVIPKGVKQITISNIRTGIDNFKHVKTQLADQGIEIVNQDPDIFQVRTGVVTGKREIKFYYLIRCKENAITVSGFYMSHVDTEFGSITNVGMKGSITKITFENMLSFAYTLDKGDISFN